MADTDVKEEKSGGEVQHINLKVLGSDGTEIAFKIKRATPLSRDDSFVLVVEALTGINPQDVVSSVKRTLSDVRTVGNGIASAATSPRTSLYGGGGSSGASGRPQFTIGTGLDSSQTTPSASLANLVSSSLERLSVGGVRPYMFRPGRESRFSSTVDFDLDTNHNESGIASSSSTSDQLADNDVDRNDGANRGVPSISFSPSSPSLTKASSWSSTATRQATPRSSSTGHFQSLSPRQSTSTNPSTIRTRSRRSSSASKPASMSTSTSRVSVSQIHLPPHPPATSHSHITLSSSHSTLAAAPILLFLPIQYWRGKTHVPLSCNLFYVGCPVWKVDGFVKEGYENVREAFRKNFEDGWEVGAGFAAYVGDEKIIDVYGGYHDTTYTRPYAGDSLQIVFSSSKVVEGIIISYLVDRNLIDYDTKIASVWPEFAQGKKENVTLVDLLGHRAGVTYLNRGPTFHEIKNLTKLAIILAQQPHNFGGRPIQGYAANTRGWYLNEIVRRIHPLNRTMGQILKEELMPMLNFEFYLGLPEHLEPRITPLVGHPTLRSLFKILTPNSFQREPPSPVVRTMIFNPRSVAHKAIRTSQPRQYRPWPESHNRREIWSTEGPSFAGLSNARSLALLAAAMANFGTINGARLLSEETVLRGITPLETQFDAVIKRNVTFTVGGFGRHVRFPGTMEAEW
ncbi:hypothetical protein HDU76_000644 [Blyttiomyces sp. JEL0837]|nr:hypothetical protein HDU76_000644 [Blyttiomyces sp. JEL0837]